MLYRPSNLPTARSGPSPATDELGQHPDVFLDILGLDDFLGELEG